MANTHGSPDSLRELQAICADLLPVCVISTAGLTPPGAGLTLPSVSAIAYAPRGTDLVYIGQPTTSVTVPNVAGSHWLIAHVDTHSAVAGWTRREGSHLLQQQSATQPAMPDGGVLLAQVTVAGGNITAVNTAVALTPPLSRQTADAVTITGGTATLSSAAIGGLAVTPGPLNVTGHATVTTGLRLGDATPPGLPLDVLGSGRLSGFLAVTTGLRLGDSSPPGLALDVQGDGRLTGQLAVGTGTAGGIQLRVLFPRASRSGLALQPTDNDTGGGQPVVFANLAATTIGSISTTATATAYNTSSDVRLKYAVQTLADALAHVQALRPVRFRWNADDSQDEGFLAHELMTVVPHAVTGQPDAVNPDGSIRPQQVDHSKLVVWLVGAVQELAARVTSLETQLGL